MFRTATIFVALCVWINFSSCQLNKRENSFGFHNFFQRTQQPSPLPFTPLEVCRNFKECVSHTTRFRPLNGVCNNAVDGAMGSANITVRRLLKATYDDGKETLRKSVSGTSLPSARFLANIFSEKFPKESKLHTHMMPWWGQFISHDIIDTPKDKRDDGAKYNCNCESPDLKGCVNIEVHRTDDQFLKAGKKCIQVIRSKPSPCDKKTRQQINHLTSYLDAGNVYGNEDGYMEELLDPTSPIGEMKTSEYESIGVNLPSKRRIAQQFTKKTSCDLNFRRPSTMPCLASGDRRANENTGLTALHTIFVRFHNKIARMLRGINRHWDRNKIVQETRSIITAVQQIITYKEFLPTVIGENWMERFGLKLTEKGYWYGYRSYYNSDVSSAFGTAAFRFGHSSINSIMHRVMPHWFGAQGKPMPIKDSFFNSEPIVNATGGGIDAIIRGLLLDRSLSTDLSLNKDFRNFLFTHKGVLGDDLMAINIQRGRDHGLPGYNHFREMCGFNKAKSFNDLTDISPMHIQKLIKGYKNVNDIDLYIGGLAEKPVKGGAVGPTFACLIAYQFRDFRNGDRYWHENGGSMATFTARQLESLRKYSLAKLLCDTSHDMMSLQPHPMLLPNLAGNQRVACRSLPELNLEEWRSKSSRTADDFGIHRTNGVAWTAWFPGEDNGTALPATLVLREASLYRNAEICDQVLSTQKRTVNNFPQYRFLCLHGTISSSDFPLLTHSEFEYWTEWKSETNPDNNNGDDVEVLNSPCSKVIDVQAQTVEGRIPARETGDVFQSFGASNGIICRSRHQSSRRCHNYQVRYLCRKVGEKPETHLERPAQTTTTTTSEPVTTSKTPVVVRGIHWTRWISRDTESGNGDFELVQNIKHIPGFCAKPLEIEARTVGRHIPIRSTNDNIFVFHRSYGLICQNHDQASGGKCHNYEVRFKCDGNS